ncbi:MAG: hypothetical protein R2909_07405 [Gemmatimonadales bacterium]
MTEARRRGPITVAALALLALHGALAWLLRPAALRTANDDAVYLLLGRALRQLSYRDLFLVGTPVQAQYPPFYPALLAALGAPAGEHLDLFLLANVLCSVLALGALFRVALGRSDVVALLFLLLAATNSRLIAMAGNLRSEPMFMVLLALALVVLARPDPSRRSLVVAGGAAIAAALTRSIGVTLVAALIAAWLLERRWRPAGALALAAALTVGPWLVWTVVAPGQMPGRSYVADLTFEAPVAQVDVGRPAGEPALESTRSPSRTDEAPPEQIQSPPPPAETPPSLPATFARRIAGNLVEYGGRVLPAALELPGGSRTRVDNLLWLAVVLVLGGIGLLALGRWWRVAALALACYGALLVVWPYPIGRFLVPVTPLILLTLLLGAAELGRRLSVRAPRWGLEALCPALLAGAVMAGSLPATARLIGRQAACDRAAPLTSAGCADQHERSFFEATRWIASNTPETERFLTTKEGTFYYYTGRQTILVAPLVAQPQVDLRRYLEDHGARQVLLSHLKYDETWLVDRLVPLCGDFEVVHTWAPGTLLLRIGPASADRRTACEALEAYRRLPWGERAPPAPATVR